jgi:hypothetical protein
MSKEDISRFQQRWMRPVGIAAVLGSLLIVVSLVIAQVGVPSPDNSAEQLLNYQDHGAQLVLSAVLTGLGILSFAPPLYFLFRSAFARPLPEQPDDARQAPRMRGFVGAFVILGPLFVALQGPLISLAFNDVVDQFAAGLPAKEAQARQNAAKGAPARSDNGTATTSAPATHTTTSVTTTPKGKATTTTRTETVPKGACTKPVSDCVDDARNNYVDDTVRDSSFYSPAQATGVLGAVLLLGSAIYTLLWSLRTGLLTRPMAILGMIFVVALLLIPSIGPIGLLLWFAALGLMFLGAWPRPLPPAWGAGEAIPWVRPGEEAEPPSGQPGPGGTVEGSGREVSERPLPEDGTPDDGQPIGETQGQRRKKRKRRG